MATILAHCHVGGYKGEDCRVPHRQLRTNTSPFVDWLGVACCLKSDWNNERKREEEGPQEKSEGRQTGQGRQMGKKHKRKRFNEGKQYKD